MTLIDRIKSRLFRKKEKTCDSELIGSRPEQPLSLYGGLLSMRIGELILEAVCQIMMWGLTGRESYQTRFDWGYILVHARLFRYGLRIRKRPVVFVRESHLPLNRLGFKIMSLK